MSRVYRKIKNDYASLSVVTKAAFWFTVCSFLQQGISIIVTPLLTRMLTTEEYGMWSVYQTWMTIFSIFATLNLAGGGFINALIKYKKNQNAFVSSLLSLALVITIIFATIYMAGENMFQEYIGLEKKYIVVMLVEIYFKCVFSIWAGQNRYNYKYQMIVIVTILATLVSQIGSLIIVYFSTNKLETRIYTSAGIPSTIYAYLAIIMIVRGKCIFKSCYWKYMLSFNIPLIPHYLSQIILNQSDRIMIERICGASYVAYYSISYTVGSVITILLNSVMSATSPWFIDKFSRKDYENVDYITNMLGVLFAVVILVPIALGPELIRILGPREYQQAKWVIIPVAASVFFLFLYNIFSCYLFYVEKKYFIAISSIVAALLNIALNCAFLPSFGFVAAGYTTLCCYVLYAIANYIFLKKVYLRNGITKIYNFKFLFMLGLVVISISLLCNLLYMNVILRYIFLGIFSMTLFILFPRIIAVVKKMRRREI